MIDDPVDWLHVPDAYDDYDDELDTRPEEEDEPPEECTNQYVWGDDDD